MYPHLINAPLHTPLFIRHIASPSLAERCSRLGLEQGVKIEIKSYKTPIRPLWVQTHSSRIILSPSLASSLLVVSKKESHCSLMLLNSGEEGYVKGAFCETRDDEMLLGKLGLKDGAYVKKIRSLQAYDFWIEINGKKVRLSLDDAVRILGSVDGHKKQLASVHIGQPFVIESIVYINKLSANGWKYITARRSLSLKRLIPVNNHESNHTAVHIYVKNHMHLCIQRRVAQKIRVGICEVCWSCGECANL